MAERALDGVGDAGLGEWRDRGDIAFHLRRRLTTREMAAAGIAAVCDVRGTEEQVRRVERMRPFLPQQMRHLSVEQLP